MANQAEKLNYADMTMRYGLSKLQSNAGCTLNAFGLRSGGCRSVSSCASAGWRMTASLATAVNMSSILGLDLKL